MHHSQKKVLNFNAKDIYSLVLDIEKYPLFLPYVSSAKILSKNENQLTARLGVNFKGFTSSYTSKVIMLPGGDFNKDLSEIKVNAIEGPFKYLENNWQFLPLSANETEVNFTLNFKFNNFLLEKAMGFIFAKAVSSMVNAFEQRAREVL